MRAIQIREEDIEKGAMNSEQILRRRDDFLRVGRQIDVILHTTKKEAHGSRAAQMNASLYIAQQTGMDQSIVWVVDFYRSNQETGGHFRQLDTQQHIVDMQKTREANPEIGPQWLLVDGRLTWKVGRTVSLVTHRGSSKEQLPLGIL